MQPSVPLTVAMLLLLGSAPASNAFTFYPPDDPTSTMATGNVRATGGGSSLACAVCPLEFYDEGTGTLLGSGNTRLDGSYAIPIGNMGGAARPYIRLLFDGDAGRIIDAPNALSPREPLDSDVRAPGGCPTDGTCQMGTWNAGSNNDERGAVWILSSLGSGRNYLWTAGDELALPIDVVYPSSGSAYQPGATLANSYIRIGTESRFYPNVHLHEYGHYVMHTAYAEMPPANCGNGHSFESPNTVECAWSEGWADFFSIAARGSSVYVSNYGYTYNLEYPSGIVGEVGDCQGRIYETMVAATLWDLLDDRDDHGLNDELVTVPFSTIYGVLDGPMQTTFAEYYIAWLLDPLANNSDMDQSAAYNDTDC